MIFMIIPLILITIEGLFTASETGLLSIENIKVLKAKREKKKWAIRVSNFLAAPEQFFSTVLVCENFILVIASTLFTKFFIEQIGGSGAFYATLILTVFSLIIGQFIPKSIALANPEKIMGLLSTLIYYIEYIAYPVVYFYAKISKGIASIFGGKTGIETIRRLDIIYAMSEFEEKASRLAARLFDFSKRGIADVMIPLNAVFSCAKDFELDALSKKHKRIYTRIPIYKDKPDNIIGVFNIKDYFYKNRITLRKPFFINIKERCMSIFLTMKQKGQHMAIVRDDAKSVVGIVTLEDLIEELVGEIRDER
jgi:putative hemolysin